MSIPNHILAKIERRAATLLNARSFECRSERPLLSLTFDDFAASAWEVGGPVLAEYDATATFCVSAGLLETEFDGIQLARREWLPRMVEAGHEIGCHTHSHLCLQGSSSRVIEHELDRNAKTVSDLLPGYSLTTFAYPYGATGFVGKRIVARRFDAARGVWRGINHGKIDLLQLQTQSVAEVGESRDVANRFMQRLEQLSGWLVLYTHDVTDQPSAGGCTPEQLRTVLDVARANGVEIDSVAGSLHRLRAPVITQA